MDEVSELETLYDGDTKTMAGSLPQDVILFQIITEVRTKSVSRFMCVSNQWNSSLMSDRFRELHSRNFLKDPDLEDQSFLFYSKDEATFFTIECVSPPDNALCHRPLPQFKASAPRYMSILTSYHGLVCLHITTHDYQDDFILWNLLITEFKRLSKPSNPDHVECYNIYGSGYGLYYSSCKDDYKLLVVTASGYVYIYSLRDDSWRKLNKKSPFEVRNCWGPGLYWEKNLYFMLHDAYPILIRFDTKSERFHKIEFPHEYDNSYIPRFVTTVHRGSIHLCVIYNIFGRPGFVQSTRMEPWKFNADEDSWSKVVTYQLGPNDDIGYMYPLHLMSNGNWLMKAYREKGRICQVELEKKYNEDKDGHDEYKLYYSNVESVPETFKYTHTFVSPNRYTK